MRLLLALLIGCDAEPEKGPIDAEAEEGPFRGPYAQSDAGLPIFTRAQLNCPPDDPTNFCSPCCEQLLCYRPDADVPCPLARSLDGAGELALLDAVNVYPDTICRLDGPFDPKAAGDSSTACCYVVATQMCI